MHIALIRNDSVQCEHRGLSKCAIHSIYCLPPLWGRRFYSRQPLYATCRKPMSSSSVTTKPVLTPAQKSTIASILTQKADVPGGLMPALHAIQDAIGFIPPDSVPDLAKTFNISRAEVHGVITYYHYFRMEPPGRHVIQVCRAEACKSMGADALMAHAEKRLGCGQHSSTADGRYTLDPVFCLGLCASSPAIVVGTQVHAR